VEWFGVAHVTNERSAGFVVFREPKGAPQYLVLHYREGHWDFPKGHIEKGERPTDAAKRELLEETGIAEIEPVAGFLQSFTYEYSRQGKKFRKAVFFLLAKTNARKISLSHEHIGAKWLSYADAKQKLTFENAKTLLAKAHEFRKRK
jgi:8-oxo-dGTP pyrophosphatase MutT (NUDIX family)